MRTGKTGKGRKSPKKASTVQKKAMKQVDLAVVRGQITNLVGNRAVEMVTTTMNEVGKGHYLAMKYLFEMIGLCPATPPEGAPEEDSLAKTLLQRLNLSEQLRPSTEVTQDGVAEAVEHESDAVK